MRVEFIDLTPVGNDQSRNMRGYNKQIAITTEDCSRYRGYIFQSREHKNWCVSFYSHDFSIYWGLLDESECREYARMIVENFPECVRHGSYNPPRPSKDQMVKLYEIKKQFNIV